MLGILVILFAVVSYVIITLRIVLRKSDNKKLLRSLVISWILCLVLTGMFAAIIAAETYVAPDKVYKGYWYVVGTGEKVSDVYDYVGGKGDSPFLMLIFLPLMLAISGAVWGCTIVVAKERASKSATILSKTLVFIGYLCLGQLTMGIYPIFYIAKKGNEKYSTLRT